MVPIVLEFWVRITVLLERAVSQLGQEFWLLYFLARDIRDKDNLVKESSARDAKVMFRPKTFWPNLQEK